MIINELKKMKVSVSVLAEILKISRTTIYKYINLYENKSIEKIPAIILKVLMAIEDNDRKYIDELIKNHISINIDHLDMEHSVEKTTKALNSMNYKYNLTYSSQKINLLKKLLTTSDLDLPIKKEIEKINKMLFELDIDDLKLIENQIRAYVRYKNKGESY